MVLIIDGELVPDDDPRAVASRHRMQYPNNSQSQQQEASNASSMHTGASNRRSRAAPSGTGAGAPNLQFNWNAPALRFVPPRTGEQAFLGLSDVEFFGVHVQTKHIAIVLLSVFVFGLRGLLVGVLIVFFMFSQQGAGSQTQQARVGGTTGFSSGSGSAEGSDQNAGYDHEPSASARADGGAGGSDALSGYFSRPLPGRGPTTPAPRNTFGGGGRGHRLGSS
ncbi:hypothetical protein CYMTET_50770 [Cymbomonas tetramitiformis]|uniref:DUF4605 domain-containing protein n=1 Tax=Cymbomonas tetramitiformis TaxID=36881 RepID=A0AAE0EUF3_9CHLO|nr:hypothetical protein CYMTET_50770 [Cymbomonas tetramitiformis]